MHYAQKRLLKFVGLFFKVFCFGLISLSVSYGGIDCEKLIELVGAPNLSGDPRDYVYFLERNSSLFGFSQRLGSSQGETFDVMNYEATVNLVYPKRAEFRSSNQEKNILMRINRNQITGGNSGSSPLTARQRLALGGAEFQRLEWSPDGGLHWFSINTPLAKAEEIIVREVEVGLMLPERIPAVAALLDKSLGYSELVQQAFLKELSKPGNLRHESVVAKFIRHAPSDVLLSFIENVGEDPAFARYPVFFEALGARKINNGKMESVLSVLARNPDLIEMEAAFKALARNVFAEDKMKAIDTQFDFSRIGRARVFDTEGAARGERFLTNLAGRNEKALRIINLHRVVTERAARRGGASSASIAAQIEAAIKKSNFLEDSIVTAKSGDALVKTGSKLVEENGKIVLEVYLDTIEEAGKKVVLREDQKTNPSPKGVGKGEQIAPNSAGRMGFGQDTGKREIFRPNIEKKKPTSTNFGNSVVAMIEGARQMVESNPTISEVRFMGKSVVNLELIAMLSGWGFKPVGATDRITNPVLSWFGRASGSIGLKNAALDAVKGKNYLSIVRVDGSQSVEALLKQIPKNSATNGSSHFSIENFRRTIQRINMPESDRAIFDNVVATNPEVGKFFQKIFERVERSRPTLDKVADIYNAALREELARIPGVDFEALRYQSVINRTCALR